MPARIGRELRAQVGEILLGFARRIAPAHSSRRTQRFVERAVADDARRGAIRTPSSSMCRLPGGIEPGVTPPTSA